MNNITASIGRGGANNRPEEIRMVQQRLNQRLGALLNPLLVVDAAVGPKTIAAIELFQKLIVGLAQPDGLIDVGGRTIRALLQEAAPPPADKINQPPPPTNATGSFTTEQQKAALLEAAKMYNHHKGKRGLCARYTYNLAHNYIKGLRGQTLHDVSKALLPAGGNANERGYHDNLKRLGYSENMVTADGAKATVVKLIQSTIFNVGDVIVYWSLVDDPSTSDGHWMYGHTQLFTNKVLLPAYSWASDPEDNYGTDFVYRSKPSNNWALKIFRAPAA